MNLLPPTDAELWRGHQIRLRLELVRGRREPTLDERSFLLSDPAAYALAFGGPPREDRAPAVRPRNAVVAVRVEGGGVLLSERDGLRE